MCFWSKFDRFCETFRIIFDMEMQYLRADTIKSSFKKHKNW
jgi:hypothetical protein